MTDRRYLFHAHHGGGWTLVAKSLNDVGVSTWTAQANWNSCLTDTSTSSCGASARWLDKTITGTSYMIQNNNIAAGKKLVVRLNTQMSWWDMRGVPVLDPRIVHTYMSDVPATTFVGYNIDSSSATGCQDIALNTAAYRWSLGNGNTPCGGTFSLFLYDGAQGGSVGAVLWLR